MKQIQLRKLINEVIDEVITQGRAYWYIKSKGLVDLKGNLHNSYFIIKKKNQLSINIENCIAAGIKKNEIKEMMDIFDNIAYVAQQLVDLALERGNIRINLVPEGLVASTEFKESPKTRKYIVEILQEFIISKMGKISNDRKVTIEDDDGINSVPMNEFVKMNNYDDFLEY